jgi:hypothetical protein
VPAATAAPAPAAEQGGRRGEEDRPHDQRVEDDRDRGADTEHLHAQQVDHAKGAMAASITAAAPLAAAAVSLSPARQDEVNAKVARIEQIKRFAILDHDLSQTAGELTPTLKVKRAAVNEHYRREFEALYE